MWTWNSYTSHNAFQLRQRQRQQWGKVCTSKYGHPSMYFTSLQPWMTWYSNAQSNQSNVLQISTDLSPLSYWRQHRPGVCSPEYLMHDISVASWGKGEKHYWDQKWQFTVAATTRTRPCISPGTEVLHQEPDSGTLLQAKHPDRHRKVIFCSKQAFSDGMNVSHFILLYKFYWQNKHHPNVCISQKLLSFYDIKNTNMDMLGIN